jgi:hypothetical protein
MPSERPEEATTRELKLEQEARERDEHRRVEASELPGEAKQHERREEKAAYLKRKLAEREEAERNRP